MKLRNYQENAIAEVRNHFIQDKKKVILQMPTGAGKTVTFAHIVKNAIAKGKKVLILAHRKELITQAYKTLLNLEIQSGLIMAGYSETLALPVQIASIQTLTRRLDTIKIEFDLIIVDEAHHARANGYLKVFERWAKAFVLGVTATPVRIDGKGLGDIFHELVHGLQISELVEMGNLVTPTYFVASAPDLSSIGTVAGDYNLKELDGLKEREVWLQGDLVETWEREAKGLQTIVFAIDVKHSLEIVDLYRQSGVNAWHIDANTLPEQRSQIIEKFAKKEITVLSNVGIFTEGFDAPNIACVQLARPTKSISLYFQMIGRALRPSEGKNRALILDHVGAYHEHGSVIEPRIWELTDTKKKKRKAGDSNQAEHKIPVACVNGETKLMEIVEGGDWLKLLNDLIRQKVERGYQKAWIVFQFKKTYPSPNLEQYKTIGRALGYHHGWAARQLEFNEKESDIAQHTEEVKKTPRNRYEIYFDLYSKCSCKNIFAKIHPAEEAHQVIRESIKCSKCEAFLGWLPSDPYKSVIIKYFDWEMEENGNT